MMIEASQRPLWRSFILPVGFTLFLWGTISYARVAVNALREKGILSALIWVLACLFVAGLVREWRRLNVGFSYRQSAIIAALMGAYLWCMLNMVVMPEERMHFILVGLATYLYHRAFRATWPDATWVPWLSLAAGAFVGVTEEWLQKFVPTRYFDWRDVRMNVLAAVMAWVAIRFVLEGNNNLNNKRRVQ